MNTSQVVNPLSLESPEALADWRDKEADDAQIDAKIASEWIDYDGARNMMYWDLSIPSVDEVKQAQEEEAKEIAEEELIWLDEAFDTNSKKDTVSVRSELTKKYDSETYAGQIRTRMAERFDTENGWNAEILENQLSTESGKKENREVAQKFFFWEQAERRIISALPEKERARAKEWVDVNLKWNGPLVGAFYNIQSNFVLPEEISSKNSFEEIYEENTNNISIVNDALADAILLEITENTIQWNNYSEVYIKALIYDIKSIETNPIEKLQKFGEIHTHINTSNGQWWFKQSKEFRLAQTNKAKAHQAEQAFQVSQAEMSAENSNKSRARPNDEEILPNHEDNKQGWEVMTAGVWDLWPEHSEQAQKAA